MIIFRPVEQTALGSNASRRKVASDKAIRTDFENGNGNRR
jgi:hypothetical protein